MVTNCFFEVAMKHLKTNGFNQIQFFQVNLDPWKRSLKTVNPIGGCVASAHLNVHIQRVEAGTGVAFSPGKKVT